MVRFKKISLNEVFSFIIAVNAFVFLRPYFVWETFLGGSLTWLRNFAPLLSYILIFAYFIFKCIERSLNKRKMMFSSLFFVIDFILILSGGGFGLSFGNICFHFFVVIFILYDDVLLKKVFFYFSWIFALSLVPGIIMYIIKIVGLDFPHDTLSSWEEIKVYNQSWYDHYFLCVFRMEKWGRKLLYLNGMFDEQGLIGTFCALFLIADRLELKKNIRNCILFIGGILSMSLAFYLLIFIYYILNSKISINKKIIIFISMFIAFITANIFFRDSLFYSEFVSRFLGNPGSRYDSAFDLFYDSTMTFNSITTWFGHGKDSFGLLNSSLGTNLMNVSSYKILIYDYGYIGFTLIIIFFVYGSYLYTRNFKDCLFSLMFTISIYQRPYVLTFAYMVLFITGLTNFTLKKGN